MGFVNMGLKDVHEPWAPDDVSMWEGMVKGSESEYDRYLAKIFKMEKTLCKLFDRLDQIGEIDNTLVIVTADNGPSSLQLYYGKGHTAPGSTEHLRGRK